jgi:hypothetical protein
VVPGVAPEGHDALPRKTGRSAGKKPSVRVPAEYQRAEGVYVDIRFFGGRRWSAVRDEAVEQLGAIVGEETTPQGQKIMFERGSLQAAKDVVFEISVPLPQPLPPSEALALVGLPASNGGWRNLSRQYRLTGVYGFRRILLEKDKPGGDLVAEVQAWKFVPADG